MKNNLFLTLPKPCTENWENMTPEEKGRHCASCNKMVVDFSKFTDKELVEFMQKAQGKICGRFSPYQLNRELTSYEPDTIPLWQRVMWGTALATSLAACNSNSNANSQIVQGKIAQSDTANKKSTENTSAPANSYIIGKMLDEKSGNPISYLVIRINKTKYYAHTDDEGNFKIEVPDSIMGKKIKLAISEDKLYEIMAYNYREIEYTIDRLPFNVNIKMQCTLDDPPPLMGDVCINPRQVKQDSNYIYPVAENMPKFKGDLVRYLAEHIKYPDMQDKNVEGTVYVSFVVEKSGEVSNVKILKGVIGGAELDSAAIKAIREMPKWIPGSISDTTVRVQMTQPIKFKLEDDTTKGKK